MSNEANVWNPRTLLELSADTKSIEERITATAGQSLFTLKTFAYTLGVGSLEVHKNGLLLTKGVDWVEGTTTTFSVITTVLAGDQVVGTGHVAITGDVDVRDTDIFVTNYQAVRDYVGTEISLWVQGQATHADGGEAFFQKVTGQAPGFFVDDNLEVLIPTGGDGSIGWIRGTKDIDSRVSRLNPATLAIWQADISTEVGDVVTTKEASTGNGGGAVGDVVAGQAVVAFESAVLHSTLNIKLVRRPSLVEFTPVASMIYGGEQFTNVDTFDDGLSVILAFADPTGVNANLLPGTQSFRYLVAGYDNTIEAITPAEINGRGCGHMMTHHSQIKGTSNHSVCAGGSMNTMTDAHYSFLGGLLNEMKSRTADSLSNFNVMFGTGNVMQGNNNACFGVDNVLEDNANSCLIAGAANTGKSFCLVAGTGNTTGSGCVSGGTGNQTGDFAITGGTANLHTGRYSVVSGNGAVLGSDHDHSTLTGCLQTGKNLAQRYTLPLVTTTKVGLTSDFMESIDGGRSVISIPNNSLLTMRGQIIGTDNIGSKQVVSYIEYSVTRDGAGVFTTRGKTITYGFQSTANLVVDILNVSSLVRIQCSSAGETEELHWFGDIEIAHMTWPT